MLDILFEVPNLHSMVASPLAPKWPDVLEPRLTPLITNIASGLVRLRALVVHEPQGFWGMDHKTLACGLRIFYSDEHLDVVLTWGNSPVGLLVPAGEAEVTVQQRALHGPYAEWLSQTCLDVHRVRLRRQRSSGELEAPEPLC